MSTQAKNEVKKVDYATFQAIQSKLATGKVLTVQDWNDLATYGTQQAQEEQKTESLIADTLADLHKAKIDPQKLTAILEKEGLIILPKIQLPPSVDKGPLFEESVTTPKGRKSTFKIWKNRDVKALTGDALQYWTAVKGKGKEYFISNLTELGKQQYAADPKYIDSLF